MLLSLTGRSVQLRYKVEGLISRGIIRLLQVDAEFIEVLSSRPVQIISAALSILANSQLWLKTPAEVLRRQAREVVLERELFSRYRILFCGLPT